MRLALVVLATSLAAAESPCQLPSDGRPDFFVVLIDTARADAFRTWNPGLPVGDALEGLAQDGVVFERLRAPTSWTRPSVASLLTGLPPARHQVNAGLDRLSAELETLPTLLQRAGYRTLAWSASTQVLPVFGFGRGFDAYVDLASAGKDGREARRVFEAARRGVAEAPVGGGFYYIHLFDPHYPYAPPPEHQARLEARGEEVDRFAPAALPPAAKRDPQRDPVRYLAEVRDADAELGRFLEFLRETGRYEPAIVLVVSDHGEELLDRGGQGHGHTLYDEQLRVPGVLKLPGNARAGTRVSRDVELQDLAATVSRWLPIDPPPGSPGIDAFDPAAPQRPRAYQSEHLKLAAVRDGSWKLIVRHEGRRTELYDLSRDPGERRDRSGEEPERVRVMLATLDRIQAQHAPGWHLRGCGCRVPVVRLAFRLEGVGAASNPVTLDLEAGDRVSLEEGGAVHRFDLAPNVLAERMPRTDRPFTATDRDEVVWPAAAGPVLRTLGEPFPVAIGNGPPAPLPRALDLASVRDRARVHASEPLACTEFQVGRCEPFLRVWYTAPPTAVPESEIDPAVVEQLRALGYTW